MKEISFIHGTAKIRLRDDHLSAYLDRIRASGYSVWANKCKLEEDEDFRDVLMIGKSQDFELFFSKKAGIKEINQLFPGIYLLIFDNSEIILYFLGQEYEVLH